MPVGEPCQECMKVNIKASTNSYGKMLILVRDFCVSAIGNFYSMTLAFIFFGEFGGDFAGTTCSADLIDKEYVHIFFFRR